MHCCHSLCFPLFTLKPRASPIAAPIPPLSPRPAFVGANAVRSKRYAFLFSSESFALMPLWKLPCFAASVLARASHCSRLRRGSFPHSRPISFSTSPLARRAFSVTSVTATGPTSIPSAKYGSASVTSISSLSSSSPSSSSSFCSCASSCILSAAKMRSRLLPANKQESTESKNGIRTASARRTVCTSRER